ncbi:hypothetical protein CQW23_19058 [Capsicum baccatum]|uniref:VASt domain-containing protein n=1 Tax=Capsicum baccatum TaxID=33114 RepID=A0A2G2W4R2_CAPBA|nr:hypothetical protein CQW23_19058 [Capsicum baccatum]
METNLEEVAAPAQNELFWRLDHVDIGSHDYQLPSASSSVVSVIFHFSLSQELTCQWHSADDYDGQVREITFRTICNSPMCPPDSAMTEYQHAILSPDKKMLVFETVQQAHDVPFGSCFEILSRNRPGSGIFV